MALQPIEDEYGQIIGWEDVPDYDEDYGWLYDPENPSGGGLEPPGSTWDPGTGTWGGAPEVANPDPVDPTPPDPITADPTQPPPTPTGGDGGGGGGDYGPLLQPYTGQFQAPAFGQAAQGIWDLLGPAPEFDAPELPTIDPFSYDAYRPTTGEDVFADPSFGFRKDIGEKALMNSRAAQGLLRTGGTLKDLLGYNQNFASQEFGNIDTRRRQDYQTNRGNAMDTWRSNADVTLQRAGMDQDRARSIYEPQLFEWTTKGNLGVNAENDSYDRAYREFLNDYSMWRDQQNDVFDRLGFLTNTGLNASA